ncbi:hypothetical protein RRG08_009523 [Elysia crispata]|uniref:Uncharacterized protein n=1 Tax=Elysia crispata TaxID=231223 RepID=A0AAE1B3E5_9GAST|nr:hypothetical protein RRG08_009523 [Elysia crispata]
MSKFNQTYGSNKRAVSGFSSMVSSKLPLLTVPSSGALDATFKPVAGLPKFWAGCPNSSSQAADEDVFSRARSYA